MSKVDQAGESLNGTGKLYIDRYVNGVPSGNERYIGNANKFDISPSTNRIELRSSSSQSRSLLRSDVIGADLDISIVGTEFHPDNVALVLFGEKGLYVQTGASIADEAHASVEQGTFVRLPFRGLTNVVVTGTGGTPTHVAGTDYEVDAVDAVEGRVYIIPAGGITDGSDLEIDYDYATQSLPAVRGSLDSNIKALIRFVSDNPNSPEQSVIVWRASISGDGAVGFISDQYGNWSLSGKIESDEANHPTEPHYRLIRRN